MCQPGRPRPHGVGHDGSPGLAPFHSVKSRSSRLPVATPSPWCTSSIRWPDSCAVLGEAQHVEVDVAVAGVGMPGVDQSLDQLDDLGDVAGGARFVADGGSTPSAS